MGYMAHKEWAAMESLQEIEFLRSGVEGWEGLRQRAIGTAWGRETSLPHLYGHSRGAVIADLTR